MELWRKHSENQRGIIHECWSAGRVRSRRNLRDSDDTQVEQIKGGGLLTNEKRTTKRAVRKRRESGGGGGRNGEMKTKKDTKAQVKGRIRGVRAYTKGGVKK